MQKYLKQYYNIIERYRHGEFGQENLSVGEILEHADAPDLFDRMTLSELKDLTDRVGGLLRAMVNGIYNRRENSIRKMSQLEQELDSYHISQYCNDEELSILQDKLKLCVQYMKKGDLPVDVEALLEPSPDDRYLGVIKISSDSKTKFPYMHEIIHYIRDVGEGKRVSRAYTRKVTGKTDSDKEQEINYLTAAAVMPLCKVTEELQDFEEAEGLYEDAFIKDMATKYGQEYETVRRRFIEVRSINDYNLLVAK